MLILDEYNQIQDTDKLTKSGACNFSVLRLKDLNNPDFYFDKLEMVDVYPSPTATLQIGPDGPDAHIVRVPLDWSILCADMEYVQTIPLVEFSGRVFHCFCLNPIDGYIPYHLRIRLVEIQEGVCWRAPPIQDKDMLVVPIGPHPKHPERGPTCAIMGPRKLDIHLPIADII